MMLFNDSPNMQNTHLIYILQVHDVKKVDCKVLNDLPFDSYETLTKKLFRLPLSVIKCT